MVAKRKQYDDNHYPKILNKVITNPNLIFVFDNVLNENELSEISNLDWISRFWIDGYNTWPQPSNPNTMPFADLLVDRMVESVKKISKNTKIKKHIGSYFVLKDHTNENLEDNIHRDFYNKEFAWSGVYHLIGNSGDTIFYPNFHSREPVLRVNFKPGRLIIFPSLYAHQAGMTNPGSLRLVHTVRVILKGKINKNYF